VQIPSAVHPQFGDASLAAFNAKRYRPDHWSLKMARAYMVAGVVGMS
jgi:hypothetical protein